MICTCSLAHACSTLPCMLAAASWHVPSAACPCMPIAAPSHVHTPGLGAQEAHCGCSELSVIKVLRCRPGVQ